MVALWFHIGYNELMGTRETVAVTIRWDPTVWRVINAIAAQEGMSANFLVNLLMKASLRGHSAMSVAAGIGRQEAEQGTDAWKQYLTEKNQEFSDD